MQYLRNNFYVITGGPGSGKTTLLESLESKGFSIVPEVAREIIKEQIETNGNALPWGDKEQYTELMLKRSVDSYLDIGSKNSNEIFFFDRGIPDTICYAEMTGQIISSEMANAINNYHYNRKVFILPPWKEIYQTDSERKQTWEEAEYTFRIMKKVYLHSGYDVIEIPKTDIQMRAEYVINYLLN